MIKRDVAIVGAGPIGIEMAVALKRHDISYVQFDAKQVGQTMSWWPPMTRWFSSNERIAIAGVPLQTVDQGKATREDYLRYLRTVVEQFDLSVNTFEPVSGIEKLANGGFVVSTSPQRGGQRYQVQRIILATGGTAHPRRLSVPGEDLPHVTHYMEDPHQYFRKRVLVVGGRNSAVEAALRIQQVGADVTISYRGSEFNAKSIKYWLYPEIMGLIRSGRIRAHFNTVVSEITPSGARLASCDESRPLFGNPGSSFNVPADFILLMVGYLADMSLVRLAGVELVGENEIPVFDERTMETNVSGIYIAGTASGGTQARYRIFLENCHIHIDRILASIMGAPSPPTPQPLASPES
ncbi:MAG TPA: NAD(P)-binding domain-containing protein [Tepidisphaeraceae bacterium]|nr:NAD(P)-binding domain-containing protein [Tepidisphaeraceae bacterium]